MATGRSARWGATSADLVVRRGAVCGATQSIRMHGALQCCTARPVAMMPRPHAYAGAWAHPAKFYRLPGCRASSERKTSGTSPCEPR
jgi:hypothetical protein